MLQKRTLLDSTNLNNAFLSLNATGDQTIASNFKVSGGALTLKNTIITDNANATYLRIDPQGNQIIIYDGVSNQSLQVFSSSGSESLQLTTINGTTSYAQIDAVGVDHLKINPSGKIAKLGGALHFTGTTSISSDSQFNFLTIAGGAQAIRTGGLLASNSYSDASNIPANGIYSKGNINTAGSMTAVGLTINGASTMNGALNIGGGNNLYIKSNATDDAGDIIFQNTAGAEITRIYSDTTSLRVSVGSTVSDKLVVKSDGTTNVKHLYLGLGISGTVEGSIYQLDGLFGTNDIRFGIGSTPYHYMNATGLSLGKTSAPAVALDVNGQVSVSSNINLSGLLNHSTTDSYDKIRVWNSGSYAIGMKSAQAYGYVNDYAMTFTMNNDTDRGFLWRDEADTATDGAMSLTTDGRLYVKDIVNAGWVYSRGDVSVGANLFLPMVNAGIELGNTTTANTPYIDFHSSINNVDYDSRIMASGGTATVGTGSLYYQAIGGHYFQGKVIIDAPNGGRFVLPVGPNAYATT